MPSQCMHNVFNMVFRGLRLTISNLEERGGGGGEAMNVFLYGQGGKIVSHIGFSNLPVYLNYCSIINTPLISLIYM